MTKIISSQLVQLKSDLPDIIFYRNVHGIKILGIGILIFIDELKQKSNCCIF